MTRILRATLPALLWLTAAPSVQAQRSGVEIWAQNCGTCHAIQTGDRYHSKDWPVVIEHMKITARLTDEEADAVLAFLKSGALPMAEATRPVPVHRVQVPVTPSENRLHGPRADMADRLVSSTPAEIFRSTCMPCHGESGNGKGPAAVVLNPKPADFTDPQFQASRTDEQLARSIQEGKGLMPPFKATLNGEEITGLVRYVRSLVKT